MVTLLIARRILKGTKGFSKPIVNIAILGIALGVAIMILTLAVVTGFKSEIREKVIGFGAHIQIVNYDNNKSYEGTAINADQPFLSELRKDPAVRHVQAFATKAGILKTRKQGQGSELHGVVVKGVGSDFDWDFFSRNIKEGSPLQLSDTGRSGDVLISSYHQRKLRLNTGDSLVIYFIQNQQQRARKLKVAGIYETGLGDLFDQIFVIADIAHIRKLNNWDSASVGGFEVLLNHYEDLDAASERINELVGFDLVAQSIKEVNRPVFSWLDAQDINAIVVISLMALVAAINMISALLVIILERTNMIGILKALGLTNGGVRRIFLYNAMFLIGRGLLIGNMIGLSICLLQEHFHFLTLDQDTYYLSAIPVQLEILPVLALNLGAFLLCMFMLLLPALIITSISPVKAIRYA